jgi:hypothetical protein
VSVSPIAASVPRTSHRAAAGWRAHASYARDAVCLVLAGLAILATRESRIPIDDLVLIPHKSPESHLTYNADTGEVRADGTRPALTIDLGDNTVTSLELDITGVDESVMPNYDTIDLEVMPRTAATAGESVRRPVASGRPDIRAREVLWPLREPITGVVRIYPPPGSRFVINGVYTGADRSPIPLFVLLTAIVGLHILAGRWLHLPRTFRGFGVLAQALWSIALVFWVGLLTTAWFIDGYTPQSQVALQPYMIQDWPEFFVDETPEKLLFAILYVGGAAAALLGPLVLSRVRHSAGTLWLTLVCYVPAAAMAAAAVTEPYRARVESVTGRDIPFGGWFWLTASFVILATGIAAAIWRARTAADSGDAILPAVSASGPEPQHGFNHDWRDWLTYVVLAVAAFPASFTAAAVRIGFETHVLSYVIGPAMYAAYGTGLAPGRDFFPQYGVGAGPLFAPFLGDNAQDAVTSYVVLSTVTLWIFFAATYVIARRALGSRLWAWGAVTIAFLHHFHLSVSGSGNMFDPSAWPIRFPLLPVFLWAVVRGIVHSRGTARNHFPALALVGVIVALSLFWNTETGVYMAITAFAAYLLLFGATWRTAQTFAGLGVVIASTFMAVSVAAFGTAAFAADYLWVLYMPLVVYGGGWSARMIDWGGHWTVVYALVVPAIGIATVGWSARLMHTRWSDAGDEERERVAWRLTLSIVGLLLLAKFYNRSLNTLWWFNSLPLLLVAAAWLRDYCRASVAGWFAPGGWSAALRTAAALLLVGTYLSTLADPRPDNTGYAFGVRAWMKHPSMLAEALGFGQSGDWSDLGGTLSSRVVDAIQQRVPEGEQAAFVSPVDWRYLILARRAPMAHFLPSTRLQLQYQLEASIRDATVLFIHLQPSGVPFAAGHPTLWRYLEPVLASRYRLDTTVDDVAIYVLRDRTARS